MENREAIAWKAMADMDKNFCGVTIPISRWGDGCLFHPQKFLPLYYYIEYYNNQYTSG